ncbi:MAG: hypothetical protein R3F14_10240 [Polyangiaceae bacterium]
MRHGPSQRSARRALVACTLLAISASLPACGGPTEGSGAPPGKDPVAAPTTASPGATAEHPAAAGDSTAHGDSASPTATLAAVDPPSSSSGANPQSASPATAPHGATAATSASNAPSAEATASAVASASAAPTATAEPALSVNSSPVQEPAFSVWMSSAKTYKAGQTGYVEAVVVPKGGYHCNEKYPFKVKMGAAPAGVAYSGDIVRGGSVSATRASVRIPFTPSSAGDARISGKFYFSVCNADQCVIDNREVAATVKVE